MRMIFVVLAILSVAGCHVDLAPTGPLERLSKSVDRDNTEQVKVDLNMGVGELRVKGGATKLMEGEFEFNAPSWKPEVRYSNTGVRGYLSIAQPDQRAATGNVKNRWEIALPDDIPLDLTLKFGVGQAQLDLGSMMLRNIEAHVGVGEIKMDLRGDPKRDYDVHIRGGVGQATVYLPSNVGLYAEAQGGIGEIKVSGLRKEGRHWVNDAYDKAKVKVHVDVHGGIGEIRLVAD